MTQLKTQNRLTIRITDELFDLSTMASEYFKEHIERRLPDLLSFGPEEHINYPSMCGEEGGASSALPAVFGVSVPARCLIEMRMEKRRVMYS